MSWAEERAKRDAEDREQFEQCIHHIDMAAELAKPPTQEPWRIRDVVSDSTLVAICGRAGSGKSFLGMAACAAVQEGSPLGGPDGLECGSPVRSVYVDGEMGRHQMVSRFRTVGYGPRAFEALDVQGLDLGQSAGLEALESRLRALRAGFVVFDSLRRLAPGKRENDSDDMAPLIAGIATMVRTLGVGALLLHHSGYGENGGGHFARGSSAIVDQVDALAGFTNEGDTLRRLSFDPEKGGKMRMAASPPDRYFRLVVGETPGVVVVLDAEGGATTTTPRKRARHEYAERIMSLLEDGPLTRREIAEQLGVDVGNQSMRDALADLSRFHRARRDEQNGNRWGVVVVDTTLGTDHHHPTPHETGGEA